jgi:MFS superfamily sulfate permease-like transporter
VLLLGPLNGLLLAIAQSLLGLVYRSMQVHVDVMGRVAAEKAAWGSVRRDESRRTYPGVLVLRPDGPLFWANATPVVRRIEARAAEQEDLRSVVLDLEATNQMDTTTAERLSGLLTSLRGRGVDLHLVRVFGNVREVLGRSGFLDELGPDHVWHSISAGVKCARKAPAFAWTDDSDLDEGEDAEHIASRSEDDDEGI